MSQTFLRRNLPHLYDELGTFFITYRLANSIPLSALKKLEHSSNNHDFENFKNLFIKYDQLLDLTDFGVNYLINDKIVDICKGTLHYPDGKEYKLICYCIMPNHVHFVIRLLQGNSGISNIMKGIKGTSARKSNLFLGRTGKFWQDESYDRLIRNDVELYFVIKYVLLNPVKSGLVKKWSDWQNTFCDKNYIVL